MSQANANLKYDMIKINSSTSILSFFLRKNSTTKGEKDQCVLLPHQLHTFSQWAPFTLRKVENKFYKINPFSHVFGAGHASPIQLFNPFWHPMNRTRVQPQGKLF